MLRIRSQLKLSWERKPKQPPTEPAPGNQEPLPPVEGTSIDTDEVVPTFEEFENAFMKYLCEADSIPLTEVDYVNTLKELYHRRTEFLYLNTYFRVVSVWEEAPTHLGIPTKLTLEQYGTLLRHYHTVREFDLREDRFHHYSSIVTYLGVARSLQVLGLPEPHTTCQPSGAPTSGKVDVGESDPDQNQPSPETLPTLATRLTGCTLTLPLWKLRLPGMKCLRSAPFARQVFKITGYGKLVSFRIPASFYRYVERKQADEYRYRYSFGSHHLLLHSDSDDKYRYLQYISRYYRKIEDLRSIRKNKLTGRFSSSD